MVEECSRDETGVGPAMASGSQVCSGNWPLLPMAAMNNAMAAQSSTVWLPVPERAQALIAEMEKPLSPRLVWAQVLAPKNTMAVPTKSPTSPVRTVKNALRAALEFAVSSHQCPINRNEQTPMISQPRISWTMFSASTMASMPAENRVREEKKKV